MALPAKSSRSIKVCALLIHHAHFDTWDRIEALVASVCMHARATPPGLQYIMLFEFMQLPEDPEDDTGAPSRRLMRNLFEHSTFLRGKLPEWLPARFRRRVYLGECCCAITLFEDQVKVQACALAMHEPIAVEKLKDWLLPGPLSLKVTLGPTEDAPPKISGRFHTLLWYPWMRSGPRVSAYALPSRETWAALIEKQCQLIAVHDEIDPDWKKHARTDGRIPSNAQIQDATVRWRRKHENIIVVSEIDRLHNWHATPCTRVTPGYWDLNVNAFQSCKEDCVVAKAPSAYLMRLGRLRQARADDRHHLPPFWTWQEHHLDDSNEDGSPPHGAEGQAAAAALPVAQPTDTTTSAWTHCEAPTQLDATPSPEPRCLLCTDGVPTLRFEPCMHQGVCGRCAQKLQKNTWQQNKKLVDMRFQISAEKRARIKVACAQCGSFPSTLKYVDAQAPR